MIGAVEAYMNHDPLCVEHNVSIIELFEKIKKSSNGYALIVNDNVLVGVISKEDILKRMLRLVISTTGKTYSEFQLNTILAEEVMSKRLYTAKPDDSIASKIDWLLEKDVYCLPVVNENNEPIGIVTILDLLKNNFAKT